MLEVLCVGDTCAQAQWHYTQTVFLILETNPIKPSAADLRVQEGKYWHSLEHHSFTLFVWCPQVFVLCASRFEQHEKGLMTSDSWLYLGKTLIRLGYGYAATHTHKHTFCFLLYLSRSKISRRLKRSKSCCISTKTHDLPCLIGPGRVAGATLKWCLHKHWSHQWHLPLPGSRFLTHCPIQHPSCFYFQFMGCLTSAFSLIQLYLSLLAEPFMLFHVLA